LILEQAPQGGELAQKNVPPDSIVARQFNGM
jgi:hypothetical protein